MRYYNGGHLKEFKKWLREVYQEYVSKRYDVEYDRRAKGFDNKTMKELLKNLRLLRNNKKGIVDKIYDSAFEIVKSESFSYRDDSFVYLRITTKNPSSNYYIVFSKGYRDELNFFIRYMYRNKRSGKIILLLNESLLPFLT